MQILWLEDAGLIVVRPRSYDDKTAAYGLKERSLNKKRGWPDGHILFCFSQQS